MAEDRREYIGKVVDGILTYWLTGTQDETMREWWTTDDAADCALELAHVMVQSLNDAGFAVISQEPTE